MFFIIFNFSYCCSSIVVSIFPPPLPHSLQPSPLPTLILPLWFCPCVLYIFLSNDMILYKPYDIYREKTPNRNKLRKIAIIQGHHTKVNCISIMKKQKIYIFLKTIVVLRTQILAPWLVWLSGLSASLQTKGSPVRFPLQVGQIPGLWARSPVGDA